MGNFRWMRFVAVLLVFGVLLGGCAAPGAGSGPEPDDAGAEGQLYLLDDRSGSAAGEGEGVLSHRSEYPSALDEGALSSVSTGGYRQNLFSDSPGGTSGPGSASNSLNSQRIQLQGEVKAVWISYLEMQTLLTGKTESQFTAGIQSVFDNCKDYGLNTVIVHVRPFGDALYSSAYFPWSYLCTGTEGVNPGYDPLEIMVREAHSRGLRIEAWLNPYRVRHANNTATALSAANQARQWINAGDSAAIRYDGATSYNPASEKARTLIVNGAVEIVQNYAVDGIHIDDYFYPTTDAAFDQSSYTSYKNAGGALGLADWRRSNVETLVKAMYDGIKAVDPNVLFGISPQSNVETNYSVQYLDVAKVAATAGYCDYICPQIYFGFQNAVQPFQETLESWNKMVEGSPVQLYVGIAVYKVGGVDSWAGSGSNEWVNNSDLLSRMVSACRAQANCTGFVLYRYDSLFNPATTVSAHVGRESNNLRSVM